jgi:GntR family transcriptional repressor for pyruvate dehydrogenase complex
MRDPSERRVPASKSTVLRIQEMVASGAFPRGAKLPAQRDLSTRLNVSRASLREALSVLETLGLLRTEPGLGTFVAEEENEERQPWRFAARYSLQEVYQFRFVAEGYAARLAAMRVTEAGLAALRGVLGEQQEAVRHMDLLASSQHDFEFHRLIMSYSGNGVFLDLHASYRAVLLESQLLPTRRQERLWETIVEHENILRTLSRQDAEGASYFMHVHIARAADRVGVMISDAL